MFILLILVSGSETPIRHFGTSNLGGLITPQFLRTGQVYNRLGVSWAMDNDCFVSLKRMALTRMWKASQPFAKSCSWAAVPDVVGNAGATLTRFREWAPIVRGFGYPLAYVAQDGIEETPVPWSEIECLFIGGTTEFKVGPIAERFTKEAKERGKWVHMGRVNGRIRLNLAGSWGCDSVDGSGFSRAPMRHLPWALEIAKQYSSSNEIEKGA
jgi:hypothetical protein